MSDSVGRDGRRSGDAAAGGYPLRRLAGERGYPLEVENCMDGGDWRLPRDILRGLHKELFG